jgi:signal transduction histidine kinase
MDVAELRALFIFDGLTDEQLGELIVVGDEVRFDAGTVLFEQGEPADSWWVLLEGNVDLVRRAGREETNVATMTRPGVWAGGFRAWAESAGYLATGRGAGPGRMLRVPSAALGEKVRGWFPFSVHLIEGFFQTVRSLEALARQREALVALGTLAAGLAHELNNPAAAATRSVDALEEACNAILVTLAQLVERALSADQYRQLDALRVALAGAGRGADLLEVADREETLVTWCDAHGVADGWRVAPALASAGADTAWCERLSGVLDDDQLGPGLDWVAGTLSIATLLSEVKESTGRVSTLVGAVRSYSQLDRASLQLVDLTEGIDTTLVILGHKLRDGVTVVPDYAADLPRIEANPGELNQVWTNLIDNAIDAMEGRGTLRVSARADGDGVVVEIADTGPGMPPEVRARAFEPFFTTKDVGKGTGLGLDISRRIVVERHHGDIAIDSSTEGTVMRVRLPREQTSESARPGSTSA